MTFSAWRSIEFVEFLSTIVMLGLMVTFDKAAEKTFEEINDLDASQASSS
jgi:hypothetical protein